MTPIQKFLVTIKTKDGTVNAHTETEASARSLINMVSAHPDVTAAQIHRIKPAGRGMELIFSGTVQ